jgi:hypothetical protein
MRSLTLLCPWRLDGLRAGRSGLDSRQGQNVSLLHNVQTGSGDHPPSYPMSTGALSPGVKIFANYNIIYIMPYLIYRVPSFLIESRATPSISASNSIQFNSFIHNNNNNNNNNNI